ncbi:MAG: hypothetical protein GY796_30000, partial [Chloroflexi bacterium]|nr:hypothetical protein [Chloroflexota bacterium]
MKKIRALPIFICTLFLSACALQPGEETPTPASLEPTIQAQQATIDAQQTIIGELEEQLTASAAAPTVAPTLPPAAAPSPTAIPSPSPTAIISTYSGSFQDDFSADLGRYSLGEQIVFQEGGLWMGPFDQCTQFNNEHPAGCIAACLECGLELSEYEIAVDITFSDGAANRYIGV